MKKVLYILIFSLVMSGLNCRPKENKNSANDNIVGDLKYYKIVVDNALFDSIVVRSPPPPRGWPSRAGYLIR